MPPHPLTNFEIQKYYQNERRFNGVYSRDNLQKITDGVYVVNLHEYSDIGTHWIPLYIENNDGTPAKDICSLFLVCFCFTEISFFLNFPWNENVR